MSKPAETVQAIVLPTWTDPTSIAAFLTTFVSTVLGLLTVIHPGFNPPPATVQAVIGAAAFLIAGGAMLYNMIRHTTATKAALAAGLTPAVISGKGHVIVAPPVPQPVPSAASPADPAGTAYRVGDTSTPPRLAG